MEFRGQFTDLIVWTAPDQLRNLSRIRRLLHRCVSLAQIGAFQSLLKPEIFYLEQIFAR